MLADGEVGPQYDLRNNLPYIASCRTDIWGFGCIVFQCLAGQAPFRAVNQYHLLKKIQELDFAFPEGFPDEATSIIEGILVIFL